MALKAFKCESCGNEFVMEAQAAEDADLRCPVCDEDIEFRGDDDDDDDGE